jgi:hypothetical protein
LQGKARIATHDLTGLPRGFYFSISRTTSPYCVIFPNWSNHHEQTFNDFHYSYRRFDRFRGSFNDLFSLTKDELLSEVKLRNYNNYDIQGGFRELEGTNFQRLDLEKLSAKKICLLPSLITDPNPELSNMARTCARLILLASTSWEIAKESSTLKLVFDRFEAQREKFVAKTVGESTELGKSLLRFTRGRMKLT